MPSKSPESDQDIGFNNDDFEEIHQILDSMDLQFREVLTLFFLEDLSISEVARIVGVPDGTVKSRLSRAKQQMRERLKGMNHD